MIAKTNVLFVCKYNRFRSKVAEEYFHQLNQNPHVKAKSAGIIKGRYPFDPKEKVVCNAMHIPLKGVPQGISDKLLHWQTLIVIVANDVPPSIFKDNRTYNKKLLVWNVPDAKKGTTTEIKSIIQKIKRHVDILVKRLE